MDLQTYQMNGRLVKSWSLEVVDHACIVLATNFFVCYYYFTFSFSPELAAFSASLSFFTAFNSDTDLDRSILIVSLLSGFMVATGPSALLLAISMEGR